MGSRDPQQHPAAEARDPRVLARILDRRPGALEVGARREGRRLAGDRLRAPRPKGARVRSPLHGAGRARGGPAARRGSEPGASRADADRSAFVRSRRLVPRRPSGSGGRRLPRLAPAPVRAPPPRARAVRRRSGEKSVSRISRAASSASAASSRSFRGDPETRGGRNGSARCCPGGRRCRASTSRGSRGSSAHRRSSSAETRGRSISPMPSAFRRSRSSVRRIRRATGPIAIAAAW